MKVKCVNNTDCCLTLNKDYEAYDMLHGSLLIDNDEDAPFWYKQERFSWESIKNTRLRSDN